MTSIISDQQPLEERKIPIKVNGIDRPIPAVHPQWITSRDWVSFELPKDLSIAGAKETWMSQADLVLDDLQYLLFLEYHTFWSHIAFDRDLHKQLSKLLKRLPRPHDQVEHNDEETKLKLQQIMVHAFRLILRLSTHKESKKEFMNRDYYAKLIYDNFVLDVPKLIDVCSIFMHGNAALVEKLVSNLFQVQPKYLEDLKLCSDQILEAFQNITEESEKLLRNCQIPSAPLDDLVLSAIDSSSSLCLLFDACNQICDVFQAANAEFTVRLASFYHSCLSNLDEKIQEEIFLGNLNEEASHFYTSRIVAAKTYILKAVRTTITKCILSPLMSSDQGHNDLLEALFHLYTGFLSEPSFFTDYNHLHNVHDDFDIFRQLGVQVDPMRVQYLSDGIQMTSIQEPVRKTVEESTSTPVNQSASLTDGACGGGPSVASVTDEDISRVRDLFPQLGKQFIGKCLPYFDNDVEKLINALLEDNLPPHLANLNRTDEVEEEPKSYVDGMDMSKLHKGKKRKTPKDANQLLNDKSELKGLKDKFAALSMVTDDIYLDPEYDDEYDDTYDDNAMGDQEPDAMEMEGREFVLPRALGGGHINKRQEKVAESDEDEAEDSKKNLDFVRNPEEVRKEAEQRRLSKMTRNDRRTAAQPRDVVGNAKGQGQDKSVLINRARKNANKNKHHRAMADKKQSKGMF